MRGGNPLDLLNPLVPDPASHLDSATVLSPLGKHVEQGSENESNGPWPHGTFGLSALDQSLAIPDPQFPCLENSDTFPGPSCFFMGSYEHQRDCECILKL